MKKRPKVIRKWPIASANGKTFKSSRIRTINRRSRLANTFHVYKFNVGR